MEVTNTAARASRAARLSRSPVLSIDEIASGLNLLPTPTTCQSETTEF